MKEIEKAEEIKHLTDLQINELYKRYLEGEKNSLLIEEYKINITPNKLITIIPPIKIEDMVCEFCGQVMYQKRKSKSDYRNANSPIECFNCNHKVYENQKECNCDGCCEKRFQEMRKQQELKKQAIKEIYDINNRLTIDYSELTFFHKLVLLTLFRMQTDEEFDYILSLDDPKRLTSLTPSRDMDFKYIEKLYDDNVVIVDSNSKMEALTDDIKSFYPTRVQWIPNISVNDSSRLALNEIYNKIYFDLSQNINKSWEDDLLTLMYDISYEEVIQYLYVRTEELNVSFSAEKKAKEVIYQLLENFSVSEIYYFVKKAVENAHIFYAKGYAKGKKHAGNTIPNKMLSLGERALEEGWNTYKYTRDSRVQRSYLSQMLFDFFLKGDDSGFNKPIGKYWLEIKSKYFNDSDDNLTCENCGSSNVHISVKENELYLQCESCEYITCFKKENSD
ncbi:MAG: hypothetical protein KGV51_07490 [Moraxellaceae bacterium]|nr:hypothetical protein [Moraxellaceae bacterium]